MKKFIGIIAVVAIIVCLSTVFSIVLCSAISGCSNVVKPIAKSDAKKFPEMIWSTFLSAQVGYSTVDEFNDYVEVCQDAGYTNDCYSEPGYFYYGADSDGYAIQLTYDQCNHYITILATDDPDMWNKWWIN